MDLRLENLFWCKRCHFWYPMRDGYATTLQEKSQTLRRMAEDLCRPGHDWGTFLATDAMAEAAVTV